MEILHGSSSDYCQMNTITFSYLYKTNISIQW